MASKARSQHGNDAGCAFVTRQGPLHICVMELLVTQGPPPHLCDGTAGDSTMFV